MKKAFQAGLYDGSYEAISDEVTRPTSAELRDNPRAAPAKLRWAEKG